MVVLSHGRAEEEGPYHPATGLIAASLQNVLSPVVQECRLLCFLL